MGYLFDQKPSRKILGVDSLVGASVELDKGRNRRGTYFRGHSNCSWKLSPQIARIDTIFHAGQSIPIVNLEEQERHLFDRFRRHSYEQRGRVLSEWEAIFLARHHNLPVRLLDWTHNPLVALYFAALHEKDNTADGAVWWFRRPWRKDYVKVFDATKTPFDYRGVQMVFPYYPTLRMTNQSGVFTIHSPEFWTDLRALTEEKKAEAEEAGKHHELRIDIIEGGWWIVPKDVKAQILAQLERFGINARTMFPELDGLAKGLIQSERFRSAEEYP